MNVSLVKFHVVLISLLHSLKISQSSSLSVFLHGGQSIDMKSGRSVLQSFPRGQKCPTDANA